MRGLPVGSGCMPLPPVAPCPRQPNLHAAWLRLPLPSSYDTNLRNAGPCQALELFGVKQLQRGREQLLNSPRSAARGLQGPSPGLLVSRLQGLGLKYFGLLLLSLDRPQLLGKCCEDKVGELPRAVQVPEPPRRSRRGALSTAVP